MSSEATVLYDAPGPKAKKIYLLISVLTVLALAALAAYVIVMLADKGQFSQRLWVAFTLPQVQQILINGAVKTLQAFGVAAIGSLIFGLVLAFGRLSDRKWISTPVMWITELFRAIPVLIFMMLMYYGLPETGVKLTPFWAVVIALVLYNGSVLAEVFRAGIQALPLGQTEAGYAMGLRKAQVMLTILLPQAVRSMMPVIIAQLVVALKDTSLGFLITYEELLHAISQIGRQGQFGSPMIPSALIGGAMYVGMCLILSGFAVWLERRIRRGNKAAGKVMKAQ